RDDLVTGVQTCALPICSLVEVGCDDDSCSTSTLTSKMLAGVILSTQYYIRVASWGTSAGNEGAFTMTVGCVQADNQNCDQATAKIGRASCRERGEVERE